MIDYKKLNKPPTLQQHIDSKLADIANTLPELVQRWPSSFNCGHAMGYKQALLDLERAFELDEGDL